MESFNIHVAGITAQIQPLHLSTREYCRDYICDLPPEILIHATQDDLFSEQAQLESEAAEQGIRPRKFPLPFLERSVLLRKFAVSALKSDILLLHGSAVAVDGNAYLFTAPCGTGKSTHTRLWRDVFGNRSLMINDDKPFFRLCGDEVLACGAPWSGKHGLHTPVSLPLRGICILSRGNCNAISRTESAFAADFLDSQLLCYHTPEDRKAAHDLLMRIISLVPVWKMSCNRDPEAALVAFGAMSGTDLDEKMV